MTVATNPNKTVISVNGVDHYCEWVTTANSTPGTKPVMVFIHGWGGSGRYWESTAQALSQEFDCLIYDLRGFGRSNSSPEVTDKSPSERYELIEYAEDLVTLLDQLNLDKVYINAHSMGGSIAMLFLNKYPQRVERAILTCSGIFEYDEKTFNTFHKFSRYVVMFRPKWLTLIPGMDKMFMARFLYRPIPRNLSQAFLEDFLLADFDAAYGTVLTSVSKAATEWLPAEFKKLTVPTLLVAGEYDQIIPAEMGRQAATLNPNVQLAILKDTAHFPMLEDPDTYLQNVREFLGI
ncbi:MULTISPECIES: alpha/beta fold hydrolase [Planktothrix]|jgi:pimeloyl-ACP methyl ester carboxylesterase|uniref:Alpha/beta hydrolase fold protein n=2 Tax=Planktothrix TaxID=54304 RepID=A0A6J7ZP23_PLARU|nr:MULTISPECIES: alpha/beta hydrolase [Planktothrix]CAD5948422.1 Putative aminoacrylate hydrolase RutD [Planktothrix rubescens]CAC5344501.1 Alpha/beta hydrolase fold protein [Planktothrix rubescens NIVA-CYA 18]CAD5918018.1 Putative aminoacrylate hydrolase RutD [Planktothrix rubescens NIVA-CYA 18]CAH2571040.1 Putative aminoacrylate hydrolase RutD [Planktothrix rubescens]GDZ93493.1 putative esterase [Planktothrix agardhii CCAP 1459/11A]